ncbi:MAG: helix-turn-helix domain-containing protein [Actinomycetota bacterium]|nr:helix-turn-helix domain-containing protein [Actinomycetota bacterium]
MSQRQLADRVTELGVPMWQTTIAKIERPDGPDAQGRFIRSRDVDVSELVALALALDVSPLRLLLPDSRHNHTQRPGPGVRWIELAPGSAEHPPVVVDGDKAWAWAEQTEPWWDNNEPETEDPDGHLRQVWAMTRLDDGTLDYTRRRNGERIVDASLGPYGFLDERDDLRARVAALEATVREMGGTRGQRKGARR